MSQNVRKKEKHNENQPADLYLYSVGWSDEDGAYVAHIAEFPSLAAHGKTAEHALQELKSVVRSVLADLRESGETVPEPLGEQKFSGKLNLRMPSYLHRQLAIEASQEGVSLNQLINLKLQSGIMIWLNDRLAEVETVSGSSLLLQAKYLIARLEILKREKSPESRLSIGEDLPRLLSAFLERAKMTTKDRQLVLRHLFDEPESVVRLIRKYVA